MHWTHTVKDSRGVHKCLLGIFLRVCLRRTQIGSMNLYHCCHIVPWLCSWGGCTIICCRFHIYIYPIYIPGKLCSIMMCANNRVLYDPYSLVCRSHYHIIFIIQTFLKALDFKNPCQVHSFLSVCLELSQLSQLFFMQYVGLCVFSFRFFSYNDCGHTTTIITIIKSEVWPICHCLGLGNETTVCIVCLLLLVGFFHCNMIPTIFSYLSVF